MSKFCYQELVKESLIINEQYFQPVTFYNNNIFFRKYHTHVLEFDGAGNWSYRPLDKQASEAPAVSIANYTTVANNSVTNNTTVANNATVTNATPVEGDRAIAVQN